MGAKAVTVDFSGVKDRGQFNPKQVPEGDYAATIVKVEDAKAKGDNGDMYVFTIKLNKFSQNSYAYYCKITDNQLWKLRNIAVAAGLNIPKKRLKFDPNKVVGKQIGVTMIDDDPYEGKVKSVVDSVFPMSELADGADVEDETTEAEFEEGAPQLAGDDDFDPEEAEEKPKKKGKKSKAEPEGEAKPAKKKDKKSKKKKGDVEELDISDV